MANDLLSKFKAGEDATRERAYVICEDHRALKILSAWSSDVVSQSAKAPTVETWDDLWTGYAIDYAKIVIMSSLELKTVQNEVERLRLLRLIYPDGTIHKWARDVIRRKLFAKLGIKPQERPEASPK